MNPDMVNPNIDLHGLSANRVMSHSQLRGRQSMVSHDNPNNPIANRASHSSNIFTEQNQLENTSLGMCLFFPN
ncbi:hypothetical protein LINPERHAP1_LOCUS9221 [Linum perenne]